MRDDYDKNGVYHLRCDTCGKFMKDGPGTSGCFVPSSDVSYEENILQCKKCTEKYGKPVPMQNVNLDVCTWINT